MEVKGLPNSPEMIWPVIIGNTYLDMWKIKIHLVSLPNSLEMIRLVIIGNVYLDMGEDKKYI